MSKVIEWREVESSNILLVGWTVPKAKPQGMFVKFRSGSMYFYHGVSRQRAVALATAPSAGRYLNSKIKGHYESEQVDDDEQLKGAKVRWNLEWANAPTLELWVAGRRESWNERRWHLIPGTQAEEASRQQVAIIGGETQFAGNFLISRDEIGFVSFVFEADHGGGALGGTFALTDGTEYKTQGGWSSNEQAVNKLRLTDSRFAAILPHPVMDCSIFEDWDTDQEPGMGEQRFKKGHTAMAGHCELPLAHEAVARFLPGVQIVEVEPCLYYAALEDGRLKPDPSDQIALDERARVR